MVLHDFVLERKGYGKWEPHSGRYVPTTGGSRSRLPIVEDKSITRYFGFVGMDETVTSGINSIASWYQHISAGVYIPEGPAGDYVQRLLKLAGKWHSAA